MRLLPKSLHTITVLENVTRFLMVAQGFDAPSAMKVALEVLQLDKLPDGYGLAASALLKINNEKPVKPAPRPWLVVDDRTNEVLGEFDTEKKAEGFLKVLLTQLCDAEPGRARAGHEARNFTIGRENS